MIATAIKNVYQLGKATGKYRKYQMTMLGMNFLLQYLLKLIIYTSISYFPSCYCAVF